MGRGVVRGKGRRTHALAKDLNLKLRSRACPCEESVHLPPDGASSGARAEAAAGSSVPGEYLACMFVEYRRGGEALGDDGRAGRGRRRRRRMDSAEGGGGIGAVVVMCDVRQPLVEGSEWLGVVW